eukprot:COSAG01_NODE_63598_length_279_cov_0.866667_1_plen_20_part_10
MLRRHALAVSLDASTGTHGS